VIVYGRNTTIEAIKSRYHIYEIFIDQNATKDEKITRIIALAKRNDIQISFLPSKKINSISGNKDNQGVACSVQYLENTLDDIDLSNLENGSFLYIVDATFEHNIGAIIRTAECSGMQGVFIPSKINVSPITAKISTGALFHIPVVKYNLVELVKIMKEYGYSIYGIERGGEIYFEKKLNKKSLFIIGSEDKGLPKDTVGLCDSILTIPQFGAINSLNMSNAAALVIYEYVRQNKLNI
jgi:23S rRNA (guanosine2251-2'-O)-methyltransferase